MPIRSWLSYGHPCHQMAGLYLLPSIYFAWQRTHESLRSYYVRLCVYTMNVCLLYAS